MRREFTEECRHHHHLLGRCDTYSGQGSTGEEPGEDRERSGGESGGQTEANCSSFFPSPPFQASESQKCRVGYQAPLEFPKQTVSLHHTYSNLQYFLSSELFRLVLPSFPRFRNAEALSLVLLCLRVCHSGVPLVFSLVIFSYSLTVI